MKERDSNAYQERQQFVAWLQEKGLYNRMESSTTMNMMHEVWNACGKPQASNKEE